MCMNNCEKKRRGSREGIDREGGLGRVKEGKKGIRRELLEVYGPGSKPLSSH